MQTNFQFAMNMVSAVLLHSKTQQQPTMGFCGNLGHCAIGMRLWICVGTSLVVNIFGCGWGGGGNSFPISMAHKVKPYACLPYPTAVSLTLFASFAEQKSLMWHCMESRARNTILHELFLDCPVSPIIWYMTGCITRIEALESFSNDNSRQCRWVFFFQIMPYCFPNVA